MLNGTKRPPKPPKPRCASAADAQHTTTANAASVRRRSTTRGYHPRAGLWLRYVREIVNTLLAKRVVNWRSASTAGPFATEPLVVYSEPWHGQTYREF